MGFFDSEKKGQVSIEYLVLVGVSLVIIALLSGYSFVMYSQTIANNQANNALVSLSSAVNEVYSLGEGNSVVTTISRPSGITNFTATGNALIIETNIFGASSTDIFELDSNISGTLPINQGIYDIEVKNSNGIVSLNVIS